MKRLALAALVLAGGIAAPIAAQDVSVLAAATDLYASARYDEALVMLNGLRTGEQVDRKSVEQYRSLCLLALGRASEAESAIAVVVTMDPTYRPEETDASPRVRAAFANVRRRLLPEITTERYLAAKAAYDRREWTAAEEQFQLVLALIDDPDTGGRLSDLRVLAAGFLELSARAAAPADPPRAPAPEPGIAEPPDAPAPPVSAPTPERIYVADDPGVTPPVAVKQELPRMPAAVSSTANERGLLEIVVDEQGRVVSMAIRVSIHPKYDGQLLAAAVDWKYQPATLEGRPVKFRKAIQVVVAR